MRPLFPIAAATTLGTGDTRMQDQNMAVSPTN
jgi:hypothetical protein